MRAVIERLRTLADACECSARISCQLPTPRPQTSKREPFCCAFGKRFVHSPTMKGEWDNRNAIIVAGFWNSSLSGIVRCLEYLLDLSLSVGLASDHRTSADLGILPPPTRRHTPSLGRSEYNKGQLTLQSKRSRSSRFFCDQTLGHMRLLPFGKHRLWQAPAPLRRSCKQKLAQNTAAISCTACLLWSNDSQL